MKKLAALLAVPALLLAARHRDWKAGTIIETAFADQDLGTLAQVIGGGSIAIGTQNPIRRVWQGFVITGSDYVFMVACPINRHKPNVTIHGPTKYTFENGKFYLLDESGREFEMKVLEKRLPDPK